MGLFDSFRRGNLNTSSQDDIIKDLGRVSEQRERETIVKEISINEDKSNSDLINGDIEAISESYDTRSPESVSRLIGADTQATGQILSDLKTNYNSKETFLENEEMARDSVVGSAIEIMADDACQVDEKTKRIVSVNSDDADLVKYLQDFLENNVNVEDRIWEWAFEIIKHGDFKLRRREYEITTKAVKNVESDGTETEGDGRVISKSVYYENVINPYDVYRIEYMGKTLGFSDGDFDENEVTFEKPENFIHFMNSKNSKKEKVKLSIKNAEGKREEIVCYKVMGTSMVDNARYMFRIVNLLDNMLILSRVARSTQYNLVKVEVGNASPAKTQQMLSDVRRRVEGSTKMRKNAGMKTDPSPIPVNSNIYIPTRDGKGDIVIDSVNESVDVRSITDIDYFRDKEFATLKVPKQYVGFDEQMPGSLGNSSLVKLDTRYARTVRRVQTILRYGIEDLCNNYLRFRGRNADVGKFDIVMRPLSTAENSERIEEHITSMQVFDSMNGVLELYGEYVDKAKLFKTLLNLVNIQPTDIASKKYAEILTAMEEGKYNEDDYKSAGSEEEEEGEEW